GESVASFLTAATVVQAHGAQLNAAFSGDPNHSLLQNVQGVDNATLHYGGLGKVWGDLYGAASIPNPPANPTAYENVYYLMPTSQNGTNGFNGGYGGQGQFAYGPNPTPEPITIGLGLVGIALAVRRKVQSSRKA